MGFGDAQMRGAWRTKVYRSLILCAMDYLTPTLPYNQWLQQFGWLLRPMQFFSILGSEYFYLALLPVIYWAVSRRLGARLGALLLFSAAVNEIFKVGFALPRPYWELPALKMSVETSFGFPSGHAQGAWLLWLFVALQSRNKRFWVPLAMLMALCITVSRNYLGVHFLVDSIGGALIGLTILGLTFAFGPAWLRFWRQLSSFQKIVFSLLATSFLGGIYAMAMFRGVQASIMGYGQFESAEYQNAVKNAVTWSNISRNLGGFCGLLCGIALAARLPQLEFPVPLPRLGFRLVIGFAGLVVLYLGLKFALPDRNGWHFARYFATTFWIVCAAPYVFARLETQKRRVT